MILNKKALVIGGTSSISHEIIETLNSNGYFVDLTYNNIENFKKRNIYSDKYVSWHYLNLHDLDCIKNFINTKIENYYSIVVFISMTSPGNFMENTEEELVNFYGKYLVNNMLMSKYLLNKITNDGKIIYISSIAVTKPVPQINYATIKGALQSFYVSLSTNVKPTQTVISIIPGLIYDTPAFYRCSLDMIDNIDNLAKKQEIADIIINCSPKDNGTLIRVGKD
jgi:NAD(P)-dependent dehydrogenase (short-subunit alcohol dehydrogenase family)